MFDAPQMQSFGAPQGQQPPQIGIDPIEQRKRMMLAQALMGIGAGTGMGMRGGAGLASSILGGLAGGKLIADTPYTGE